MSILEWRGGPIDVDGLRQSGEGIFNVRALAYGAVGDGTADEHAAYLAAQAACGANGEVHFPAGTYRIASDLFITSATHLHSGAVLKPDSGVTVFIEAAFTASPDKHFDLSAGGKVRFNSTGVPHVYAEWWGAGLTTDDTSAMQAAIDARAYNNAHQGGPVDLLPTTYTISSLRLSGVTGGGVGVWLRGAGRYATTIITTVANGVVIDANANGALITDLRLQTAVGVTPLSGQWMIQSTSGSGVVIERVDLYKFYNGLQLNGVHVHDVIMDYGVAGGVGIHMPDSVGTTLEDVIITPRYDMAAAFHIEGVVGQPDTNLLTRCSTNGGQVPVQYATYGTPNTGVAGVACSVRMSKQAAGNPPRWTRFTDCLFETTANNSFIHCFSYEAGWDTKFTSGYLLGGTNALSYVGVSANYIDDHIFQGTIIHGAWLQGVVHNPSAPGTTTQARLSLIDCSVVDNSQVGAGSWEGIQLGANSRGFTMRGGSCGTPSNATAKQVQGLNVIAGAQDFLVDIDSIDFTGNTVVPFAGVVPTVASASAITPVSRQLFISGASAITSIVLPKRFRKLSVIPTGAFTWTTADNIAIAGTAVIGKLLEFTYIESTSKWYPSYT